MQAELIIPFIERRVRELGFTRYILEYEQLELAGQSTQTLSAYNNLYVLVDTPKFLAIESDLGRYNQGGKNIHEHRGLISLTNRDTNPIWVSFVKVIIQD